jgi:hypothetical protein
VAAQNASAKLLKKYIYSPTPKSKNGDEMTIGMRN